MNKMDIYTAYEERFGEMPESLCAPNWIFQAKFKAALKEALKSGVPVTEADLERLMGPPAWEKTPTDGPDD
jgi:hypothetical protein